MKKTWTGPNLTYLRPDSPLRPPDWRWWRAAFRLRHDGRATRQDDQATLKAMRFQRLQRKHEGDEAGLEDLAPELVMAFSVWHGGESSMRCAVESRILAGEKFHSIEQKTGLSVASIGMYESLFFNVLDRLQAPGWITHHVFGPKFHYGLTEDDIGILVRAYSYWGGPFVTDAVLTAWGSPHWQRDPLEPSEILDEDARRTLQIKTAFALRIQPADNVAALKKFVRLGFRAWELARKNSQCRIEEAEIEGRITMFMAGLPSLWEDPAERFRPLLSQDECEQSSLGRS